MAVGLFRTTVYLPHRRYTAQELEMIFRHELIHWRRKDLWYKLLLLAARSIHWGLTVSGWQALSRIP